MQTGTTHSLKVINECKLESFKLFVCLHILFHKQHSTIQSHMFNANRHTVCHHIIMASLCIDIYTQEC